MYRRTETRPIYVGSIQIGGQNKVVIQSMCNTKTKDVDSTVEQILKLENAGCEIIRVACLDIEDAKAIKEIKIKPDVVDPEDVETLEDLILTCINGAMLKADNAANESMGKYNIPGLM